MPDLDFFELGFEFEMTKDGSLIKGKFNLKLNDCATTLNAPYPATNGFYETDGLRTANSFSVGAGQVSTKEFRVKKSTYPKEKACFKSLLMTQFVLGSQLGEAQTLGDKLASSNYVWTPEKKLAHD